MKIKELFKCFKLSDLFLAIGFIPMTVFLMYGQVFMQHLDTESVGLNQSIIIPLFVILLLSWGLYIYLEFKNNNFANKYIIFIFICLAVIGVIGVLSQPQNISLDFITTAGEKKHLEMCISETHYVFFTFDIISILLFIYIGLFIFPKRFKTIKIIQVIGYLVFLGCFALIIYSYIKEFDNYGPLIKAITSSEVYYIKYYNIKSFIINPNAYGMTMMIGIIFCCINHSISKHWWYFILAGFFYANMVFSFCRASLIFSIIILLIYIYSYLISDLKNKRKKCIISLIILSSIVALLFITVLACYLSNGAFLKSLYNYLVLSDNKNTISSREIIWFNTCTLISNGLPLSLFFGRGFGIINEMLLQLNLASGFDSQLVFPTHNSYLNLLSEGGFVYLFAYIALLIYFIYIFIGCYKKQALFSTTLAIGTIVFVFYSLIETIHYLVYPFMFLMFVFYNVCYQKEENKIN